MTGPIPKPAAEIEITETLVRSLLVAERPDLVGLPLMRVDEGWDNAVWRLGEDLSVRVPRRSQAVPFLLREQRWLPSVAQRLTVQVPVPIHLGRPTTDYPWPWSICQWVHGRTVLDEPLVDDDVAGAEIAQFLAQLHQPAPQGAPTNPFRGGPLSDRDASVRGHAAAIAHLAGVATLLEMWDDALAAPEFDDVAVWIHGDLHPRNVLANDGVLCGVIDFGDMAAGDPAVDLAAAWTLLDIDGARRLRADYPADDGTWRRARGWAVNHGVACVANSADDPGISQIGHRTIGRLLEEG